MEYVQAISDFWKVSKDMDLDCKSIALMLALLHIRQERGFTSRCSVPNEWLEELLHLDIRTLRTARKRLIDHGLIQYEEGKAKRQPVYIFGEPDEPMEIPIAQDWMEEQARLEVEMQKVQEVQEVKPKTKRKAEKVEGGLFSEKALAQPKKVKKEPEPPTMDEVREQFIKRGLSQEDAERFYYYYDAQGWVTSSGQKIRRLDSMVNRWLTNNHKTNENDKRDNRTARAQEAASIIARLAAKE
jgi:hypothetical protein